MGNEAVEPSVAFQQLTKLFLPSFVVVSLKSSDRVFDEPFKLSTVSAAKRSFEIGSRKALDLMLVEIAELVEPPFKVVDHIGV